MNVIFLGVRAKARYISVLLFHEKVSVKVKLKLHSSILGAAKVSIYHVMFAPHTLGKT